MKVLTWKSLSSRKRRVALWVLGLLLFYTILGFLILPPIIRSVVVKQLSKQLDRDVSIEKIRLNPYALSCTIHGLLIKDPDREPFVAWDEFYVRVGLASFLGHPWVLKELSLSGPFVRVQMNKDYTFNFSDLVTKFSTNTAPAKTESQPLALRIDRLHIGGATAALADFTPREPFRRTLGPLDVTLINFRTDPDNKNPYAFTGTTDAGEQISWSGFFYLDPLRSEGELKLFHFALNKYAPLYQDLVRFEIRGGEIALDAKYRFALSATNRAAAVQDTAFALRDFRLGMPGDTNDIADLPLLDVTGASVDLDHHQATVDSVTATGGRLFLRRGTNEAINVVELSQPAEPVTNAPGGILFLLRSVTNAVAMLLNSTNQWSATVHSVDFAHCALHLEDLANSRPARLDLTDIALAARNISNIPGTNLDAELALRWNTNGSIKTTVSATFLPPTADIQLDLDQLDLGTLDPYLEPKLNLFVIGSKLGLHGQVLLRTPQGQLPQVTFHGDASLDDFHTVDGIMAEDLLKWDSVNLTGIAANLNPQTVSIREIAVNDAYARLIIETNGTINLLNALRLTNTNAPSTNQTEVAVVRKPAAPSATETNRPPAPPPASRNAPENNGLPQIAIGAIVISNTAISFTDRSIKPNVNMSIQQVNGRIAGLSTEQLQHADLNLNAKVDGVGPVTITGTINPFSGTQTNDVKISVKDMDLTPASPYSGKFAGYRIAEGKLNMDLTYDLVGRKLQAKNVITLDQFTFGEKVDSPEATHLPVRLGVAILKDRDGKIVLDVPVEGSLDDPKFRIGKVVARAIENILVKVATSPFSVLGALFGGGGEELGWQDFAIGSADLTPADRQKLDSLAKGLYARPALQLEIAGSVDPDGDREGLQRAALDREIRAGVWMTLRKSERATNSVDHLVVAPDERERWVKKIYDQAVASGKITPQFIAANTDLAVYAAAAVLPRRVMLEKGAIKLETAQTTQSPAPATNSPVYHTKLVPPPEPMEAILLATCPIGESDLAALAAERAKAVQAYLLQSGKVEASRLFLKEDENGLRSDGSRVYLQFR
ncbi:MAG: DUF748 domain-containing protein [Verrucomicrobiota bacterium]|jgi:hypothetical protein